MIKMNNPSLKAIFFSGTLGLLLNCGGIVTDTNMKFSGKTASGEKVTATVLVPGFVTSGGPKKAGVYPITFTLTGVGWSCVQSDEKSRKLECDDGATGTYNWSTELAEVFDGILGIGQLTFELSNGKSGMLNLHKVGNALQYLI